MWGGRRDRDKRASLPCPFLYDAQHRRARRIFHLDPASHAVEVITRVRVPPAIAARDHDEKFALRGTPNIPGGDVARVSCTASENTADSAIKTHSVRDSRPERLHKRSTLKRSARTGTWHAFWDSGG